MSSTIETEVKFHVPDPDAVRRNLQALGAESRGRSHEHNVRYDTPDERLRRTRSLLRLRQDRACTLTFKAPAPAADPAFKQMTEVEVQVGEFERMHAILSALGFTPMQVYEKRRESYGVADAVFCLDELPYGHFLEIEGEPEAILRYSRHLGLSWERRIVLSYLEIFDRVRRRYGLASTDLTFECFRGTRVDVSPLLPDLIAAAPGD
jgi:adenylate cyclase class 2